METAGKLVDDEELRDAMKDSGLGTPATRAEIIEKLIRVGYMTRDKKKLIPTPKGIQLISLVGAEIKSPELTGQWEKRLSDIAKSSDSDVNFMQDISEFITKAVLTIKSGKYGQVNRSKLRAPRPTFGKCPACGQGEIIEGKRGFGCNRFKEGCSYVVWKEFFGKKLSQNNIDCLIAGKATKSLKGFVLEDGSKVSGIIRMKEDKTGIELIVDE
jgi:DNA topoisomerase-3